MNSYLNPLARSPRIPAATAAIKQWARSALGIDDETVISINELACSEPGCPPRETVLLVLEAAAPAMRLSIHKAILDIAEQDVIDACLHGGDIILAKSAKGHDL